MQSTIQGELDRPDLDVTEYDVEYTVGESTPNLSGCFYF